MREIKFRGKRQDNGEWVYGWYVGYSETYGYIYGDYVDKNEVFEVDNKTVEQFTGLYDKNGKEIYEGDILYGGERYKSAYENPIVCIGNYFDPDFMNDDCETIELYGVYIKLKNGVHAGMGQSYINKFEVIGNIHEEVK